MAPIPTPRISPASYACPVAGIRRPIPTRFALLAAVLLASTATLGFVRRSGDAVSKLDWAGDGAERLEAFAGAKDRHVAIVEHAPED